MPVKVIYKTGLQGPQGASGGGAPLVFTWSIGDGYIKAVTHNLNTYNLSFSFMDLDNGEFFEIGDIQCLSTNVVQFTSNELPTAAGWRIVIRG